MKGAPGSLADWAELYAGRMGWAVFPLRPRTKEPATSNGFHAAERDPDMVRELWRAHGDGCNIGLRTGPASRVFVLDVDGTTPKGGGMRGPEALAMLEARCLPLPPTRRVETSAGGFHLYFAWPEARELRNRARITLDGQRTGLDCRADGGYVVLPPSVHPSGSVYTWGSERVIADAPLWLLDLLDPPRVEREIAPPTRLAAGADRWATRALEIACDRIRAAGEGMRHEVIYKESAAIGEIVGGGSLGRGEAEAALIAAGTATGKGEREVRRAVIDAITRGEANPRRPTERPAPTRTLPEPPPFDPEELDALTRAEPPQSVDDVLDAPPPVRPEPYRMTDVGNAERLTDRFGGMVRWCVDMPGDGVLVYDGHRWEPDRVRAADKLAKAVARDLVSEARDAQIAAARAAERANDIAKDDPAKGAADLEAKRLSATAMRAHRWAESSEMGQRLREMMTMARSEVAVRHDQLDADPWALNTWGGVVNLRTGDIAPHDPHLLMTKITGATARLPPDAAPTWLAFLRRIMGGDEEMVGFIQRVLGYCLTASTREQCLFVLHGAGSNGKSTFLDTVRAVLGDYAMHTRAETFIVKEGSSAIPNDVAALRGARVVTASEIKQGAKLDESLIKEMTGDSAMTARFMRGEFFTFAPTWKVLWALNHRPIIRGTDHGIWRRVYLIPFLEKIEDHEKDLDLGKKLEAERDAILAWMIHGCAMWQEQRLAPPARVIAATKEYRDDMDILKDFLDELCAVGDGQEVGNTELYTAFRRWADDNGEREKSQRWFSQALHDRGFRQAPSRKRGRRWEGLALRPTPTGADYSPRWGQA